MRIVDINGLQEAANKWNPGFEYVDNIKEAANLINLPHEDYPLFCQKTEESIEMAIDILKEGSIREFDVKALHGYCMKSKDYIITGSYRINDGVTVGSFLPPHPMYLSQLMMSICPIDKDVEDIEMWYRLFECIHPFVDGNGRLGGIIMAAVSFLQDGKYKIPKRESKETLRIAETKYVFEDGCLYNLNQPALVLEKGFGVEKKRSYYNQVEGVLCREDSFEGYLYVLPYQLIEKKPFNPKWWREHNWSNMAINYGTEDFIKGTIKKIEKLIVKHTSIDYIKIDRKTFREASAFCRVGIGNNEQNAWLTWENCD